MNEHEAWVDRCQELAGQAADAGEAPVGSVIVRDGFLLAEGVEGVKAALDVSAHAELIAVRAACRRLASLDLSGCTLYTTAEPCFLCSYALRATRISRVFFGRRVGDVGGATSSFPILTAQLPCWGPPPVVEFLATLEPRARSQARGTAGPGMPAATEVRPEKAAASYQRDR
jgi:tRNA(adenine34) deaminase